MQALQGDDPDAPLPSPFSAFLRTKGALNAVVEAVVPLLEKEFFKGMRTNCTIVLKCASVSEKKVIQQSLFTPILQFNQVCPTGTRAHAHRHRHAQLYGALHAFAQQCSRSCNLADRALDDHFVVHGEDQPRTRSARLRLDLPASGADARRSRAVVQLQHRHLQ